MVYKLPFISPKSTVTNPSSCKTNPSPCNWMHHVDNNKNAMIYATDKWDAFPIFKKVTCETEHNPLWSPSWSVQYNERLWHTTWLKEYYTWTLLTLNKHFLFPLTVCTLRQTQLVIWQRQVLVKKSKCSGSSHEEQFKKKKLNTHCVTSSLYALKVKLVWRWKVQYMLPSHPKLTVFAGTAGEKANIKSLDMVWKTSFSQKMDEKK